MPARPTRADVRRLLSAPVDDQPRDDAFVAQLAAIARTAPHPAGRPRRRRVLVPAAVLAAVSVVGGVGVSFAAGVVQPPAWLPVPVRTPDRAPTPTPTPAPTPEPSSSPTQSPNRAPSHAATPGRGRGHGPSNAPSNAPSNGPSSAPSNSATEAPGQQGQGQGQGQGKGQGKDNGRGQGNGQGKVRGQGPGTGQGTGQGTGAGGIAVDNPGQGLGPPAEPPGPEGHNEPRPGVTPGPGRDMNE